MLPRSRVLRILGNMAVLDNASENALLSSLKQRLPPRWILRRNKSANGPVIWLQAPGGAKVGVEVRWMRQLEPRAAAELAGAIRKSDPSNRATLVASPFLSPRARAALEAAGVSYADLSGNVRIECDDPGLFIQTSGASSDPRRQERPARTLKGDKAGRVVRLLLDFERMAGVRALADSAGVNPGYVSRLFALLDGEALIERDREGRVTSVRWDELLRRWAEDSPLSSRGESATFIDPRGIQNILARLRKLRTRYAITTSLAAAKLAPVAPAKLAVVYVDDMSDAAERLGLREADAGANVLLIAPRDPFVYDRSSPRDGLVYAAPSQVAADLLSSPGRGPAEADELIRWMQTHEEVWRG
jgi:hypothetical protein